VSKKESTEVDEGSERGLPREWQRWAALSLLQGEPLVDVLETLKDEGFSEVENVRFCAGLYDDPAFEAGKWLAQQLAKQNSMSLMRQQLRDLSSVPVEAVDRREGLSRQEFLNEYYSQNRPVILTDVCRDWPARTRWTTDYLAKVLGGVDVEVMAGRDLDPDYEINADSHKVMMPFDEYVAKVEATNSGNDLYLVANNGLLERPEAAPLWDDFELDERFLTNDRAAKRAFLWLGPAGTVTPLHHDTMNVMFNQVDGWKHFILIPSVDQWRLYNHLAVYSKVDPLAPDLDQYPLFAEARQIHLDIGPGESLFIPAGWWHHVVALEASISVSFTNFAFFNDIEWEHPTVDL
jgi:hypothetical protein